MGSKVGETRFKIAAFLRLAEMTDADDIAQKQRYMDEAVSLLDTLSQEVQTQCKSKDWIIAENVILEIADKSKECKWMTVTDFKKQDPRIVGLDASFVARVLTSLGYTATRRSSVEYGKQVRVRFLPVL